MGKPKKSVTTDTEQKLRETISAASDRLYDIEQAKRFKRNIPLIGKCFKYRNCYSAGDYWWLYIKVIGLDESGNPQTFAFEKDTQGEWKISVVKAHWGAFDPPLYHPIPETEFGNAWNSTLKELFGIMPSSK